jgi:hypothetical protein
MTSARPPQLRPGDWLATLDTVAEGTIRLVSSRCTRCGQVITLARLRDGTELACDRLVIEGPTVRTVPHDHWTVTPTVAG